jgi:UDP-N-acetylmuramoyl-tripeptide--D-alanyl-D-alanine ligase
LARALAAHERVVASHLSNNDLYNTARTVLDARPWTRFCVQEVGADGPGSLDAPLSLLQPDVGVVTTVGLDHLRAFRTCDAVAAEKRKVVAAVGPDGLAILNADDPHVDGMAGLCRGRVLRYGHSPSADLRIVSVASPWPQGLAMTLEWRGQQASVQTALHGPHFSTCVAAALATAVGLGMELAAACEALAGATPVTGRMSLSQTPDGVRWLRDDFKSSQWSVGAAFDYVARCRTGVSRRVIVIGTIADRSGKDGSAYAKVLAQAAGCADDVLVVGEHAHYARPAAARHPGTRFHGLPTVRHAANWLAEHLKGDDLVLLKGGRRDHLARLVMARQTTVACWREYCGRTVSCEDCALVGVPSGHDGRPS